MRLFSVNTAHCFLFILSTLFFSSSAYTSDDIASLNPTPAHTQVKPILENRCMVCHGCYDAPCQLKMESFEGLSRGMSKAAVYDAYRIKEAPLTRLYEDAMGEQAWQTKGFYSVLDAPQNDPMTSLIARMLELKRKHPLPSGRILPDTFDFDLQRDQQCATQEEFPTFARKYPLWGMPYGLPGLNDKEHSILTNWISLGAPYAEPYYNAQHHQPFIDEWETFLNQASLKHQLVSRYIYEHLYLANLYFEDKGTDTTYFKLIRSSTPPGEPIQRISTRRPYDDPGVERVYYRLWHSPDSILAKTHMPYALNIQRMNYWTSIFFAPNYTVSQLPSYIPAKAANPFITFQDIPPESRYRFMLEEASFTISNFIKGAVCRGTVALNVIQDRFWVFFAAPGQLNPQKMASFLASQDKHLQMPASSESGLTSIKDWLKYAEAQKNYLIAKSTFMAQNSESIKEKGINLIWNGEQSNQNAALTIFRHNNSASVVKGLVGTSPKTLWVIDYPILERIHYLLVAGFDVYGGISHQAMTRMYMDFLRMESEMNYLSLLPEDTRREKMRFWYRDAVHEIQPSLALYINNNAASLVTKQESSNPSLLLENKLREHLGNAISDFYSFKSSTLPTTAISALLSLESLEGKPASLLPENALISVEEHGIINLFTDTAYSNISSMFDEKERRLPREDKITLANGLISAYPNIILRVGKNDIPAMVADIKALKTDAMYQLFLDHYGVRRTDPEFWVISDLIRLQYQEAEPLTSGILDYNRLDNH